MLHIITNVLMIDHLFAELGAREMLDGQSLGCEPFQFHAVEARSIVHLRSGLDTPCTHGNEHTHPTPIKRSE